MGKKFGDTIMGSLFSSSKVQQASDPISNRAFGSYMNALKPIKGGLYDSVSSSLANPVYGGQTYADLDPYQKMYYDAVGGFANQFTDAASGGVSNATNNMNMLGDYGSRMSAFGDFLQNPDAGMDYAKAFANSDITQGMVDSASSDVAKNLGMNINNLNAGAVGGRNLNSSRTGAAEGQFQADAAQDVMNLSRDIRGNMFNQGMNQFNTNVNQQANNMANMMSGYNNSLAGLGSMLNLGNSSLGMLGGAGDFMRNFDQGQMDDMANQFYLGQDRPFEIAGNYMNLFSPLSSFGGGAGYSGAYEDPGMLGKGGQLLNIFGTGATLFCWVAREVYGEQNFKWRVFRHWMYWDAPKWLRNTYAKHGANIAEFIKDKPRVKKLLKFLMDKTIRHYGGPHGAI